MSPTCCKSKAGEAQSGIMLTMKKDDYLFGISMQMCLVLMPIKEDQGVKGDKLKNAWATKLKTKGAASQRTSYM